MGPFRPIKRRSAGKQALRQDTKSPEAYPSLKGKYNPYLDDYEGEVARSCIHCHMIGAAERQVFRSKSQPIPEEVLYPWPMPDLVGLTLHPREKAKVRRVQETSAAAAAGLQAA